MAEERKSCPFCGNIVEESSRGSDGTHYFTCSICGEYGMPHMLIVELKYPLQNGWIASAKIREQCEYGNSPVEITRDILVMLLSSSGTPQTLLEKMDRILFHLHRKTTQFGKYVIFNPQEDYPIAFARNKDECISMLEQLKEMEYIWWDHSGNYQCVLGFKGWNYLDEIRRKNPLLGNQCFVAMSFDSLLDDAWTKGIYLAVKEAGYNPLRIDLQEHNEKICDKIISEIRKSALMIADFTGHRGGVYFEAGFALSLGISVIWTCRDDQKDESHFDTRQYNHILWKTPEDLRGKLFNRIQATVPLKK